jgi:hypothetical protein
MHDHTECNVAADTEAQRENDPLLHHLNDRPCVMGGGRVKLVTRTLIGDGNVTPPVSWLTQYLLL